MGCQGSKSTATADTQQQQGSDGNENDTGTTQQQQQQQSEEQTEVYVTEEEATIYVSNELGLTNEKAAKVVKGINKNEDGKIANRELIALRDEINKRKDAIRPLFAAYDKDDSGTVSTDEAYEVIKDVFTGTPESHSRAMIKRFDKNGTGRLSFNEFLCFYAHICAKREILLKVFDDLDKDGSGSLAQDEIVRELADQCGLDESWAESLVKDFDQNKDGLLSKKEFSALFAKLFT